MSNCSNPCIPWRFIFKKNENTESELTEYEQEILLFAFPQTNQGEKAFGTRLRYDANYRKYFALRILEGQLPYSKFKKFLSSPHSREEMLNQISSWKDAHFIYSLIHHMQTYEPTSYPIQEQLNFFNLCFNCIAKDIYEALDILVDHLARGKTAESTLSQSLFDLLKEYITGHWSSNAATHFVDRISGKLIGVTVEKGFYPMINFEQIQNLSPLLLERVLEEQDRPSAKSILCNNSSLNSFLQKMIYNLNQEKYPYQDSLVIGGLIKHYRDRKGETTFEDFIDPLYKNTLPKDPLPKYVFRLQHPSTQIREVFGNSDNFKQFSEACFDLDKETLQQHYKELGID